MGKLVDLTGQRFGRLEVLGFAGKAKNGHSRWLCKCDCGNEATVSYEALRRGDTKSCGCYAAERTGSMSRKHGHSGTRLHRVWLGMRTRCGNPNRRGFENYGGRGITVCDEWLNDFQTFYDWAMANGYDEAAPRGQCTLDRVDNDGNYCPENCRWTTAKVQANNRRKCKHLRRNEYETVT